MHVGYRTQRPFEYSPFYSTMVTEFAPSFTPEPGHKPARMGFLVNENTSVPDVAWALQRSGEAVIIAQGSLSESSVVQTESLPLGDGLLAQIRMSELVFPDGTTTLRADTELPAAALFTAEDSGYQSALAWARAATPTARPTTARPVAAPPTPVYSLDKPYADLRYPGLEYRLLAAFRLWNVIHYFYPYKQLLDTDWDTLLPQFIAKLGAAQSAKEYALTIAELAMAYLQDGHTEVTGSPELEQLVGVAVAPVEVRLIEGVPVITGFYVPLAAPAGGAELGDVVLKIDGEDAAARQQRLGRYVPSSNPAQHSARLLRYMLRGPEHSTLVLTVRDRQGRTVERRLARKLRGTVATSPRTGAVFKILPGGIGYVDLARLDADAVDPMFEHLKGTRGIIFDMRGYPQGTEVEIASRLNTRHAKYAALALFPVVGPGSDDSTRLRTANSIPAGDGSKPLYSGKTVLLINESTASEAEDTGLFFAVANGTKLVGSQTCGQDGNITYLVVPGGIMISFSGADRQHADGRQLQRIGLVPDLPVKPTLAGIRAGTDEATRGRF